jgi:hypothetical protein
MRRRGVQSETQDALRDSGASGLSLHQAALTLAHSDLRQQARDPMRRIHSEKVTWFLYSEHLQRSAELAAASKSTTESL